jgi:hypothetical protein
MGNVMETLENEWREAIRACPLYRCYARAKPARAARQRCMQKPPVSYFPSGAAMRSRTVGGTILTQDLAVPTVPARLTADWEREILQLAMTPGDVEALSFARTRARWREYPECVQALGSWMQVLGLTQALATGDVAIMACRGARYHHDALQYGDKAFCNLFLSEDRGLDLHFPSADRRIALRRGCAVIFDTAQPHAVIARSAGDYRESDFAPGSNCTQVFLSWELPIEDAPMARALGVTLDVAPDTAAQLGESQLWFSGAQAEVCPHTGQWRAAPSPSRPARG